MTVHVLAFARLREVLGFGQRDIEVTSGTTVESLWLQLTGAAPDAAGLRTATRFARNGTLADGATVLSDGDEIALMPPVGGG
jgi:molybdopterin synthase sulfur carrier subunit